LEIYSRQAGYASVLDILTGINFWRIKHYSERSAGGITSSAAYKKLNAGRFSCRVT
jgi:hypothetical protein